MNGEPIGHNDEFQEVISSSENMGFEDVFGDCGVSLIHHGKIDTTPVICEEGSIVPGLDIIMTYNSLKAAVFSSCIGNSR